MTSSAVANAIGSIYCLCNILLAGFLRSNAGMPAPLRYVAQLTFVSPAYEALLINEFGYNATGFRCAPPRPALPPGAGNAHSQVT